MNYILQFEQTQINKFKNINEIPSFRTGDTLRILVKVKEGERERSQPYEGICISRRNRGLNSSITIRKISYGIGVERIFPLYSPNIKIYITRKGIVRRAKLYYLRKLSGKKARITERKSESKQNKLN
jgi:large subunit ribosomal protein L19